MRSVPALAVLIGLLLPASVLAQSDAAPSADAEARPQQTCADLVAESWSDQEDWAWTQVCEGRDADLTIHAPSELGTEAAEQWPKQRTLSAAFLRAILLEDRYRQAIPARGVHILGARFAEEINLANADIDHELWLALSFFEAPVVLDGAHVGGLLLLSGSRFAASLELEGVKIDRSLFLRDGASLSGARLSDARIGGELSLRGSRASGEIDIERAHIAGNLWMDDGTEFARVTLHSAQIQGDVYLSDGRFSGALTLQDLQVGSDLFMDGLITFEEVDLTTARIGGLLLLDQANICSDVLAAGLQIGGDLRMDGARICGELDLSRARIGGDLRLHAAILTGRLGMEDIEIGSDLLMHGGARFQEVRLLNADIAGDIDLSRVEISGELMLEDVRVGSDLFAQDAHLAEVSAVGASIASYLLLDRSTITGSLDLTSAKVGGYLRLNDAAVCGTIDLERVQVGADLVMYSGGEGQLAEFGAVRLVAAQVDGDIAMGGARFHAPLEMEDLRVGSDLVMNNGARFAAVNLSGAVIGSYLRMNGAQFEGDVLLTRAHVGGHAILTEAKFGPADGDAGWIANCPPGEAPSADPVGLDLLGSGIDGDLFLDGAEITGHLSAQDLRIGSDLLMRRGGRFNSVELAGAEIGSYLMLDGSHFGGLVNLESVRVGKRLSIADGEEGRSAEAAGASFDGRLVLAGARVGGDALIAKSSFADEVDLRALQVSGNLTLGWGAHFERPLQLSFAQIGSNLDLTAGIFESVDLTGSVIGAEIRLASQNEAAHMPMIWNSRDKAKLTLRNVKAGALQDLPEAWPDLVDLEGFTYARLGGFLLGADPRAPAAGSDAATGAPLPKPEDIANREVGLFIDWLAKQKSYSPQPYTQLAAVLQESGQPDKAKRVLFAGKLREMGHRDATTSAWLFLQLIFTGFGFYPWISLFWVIGLVAFGAYVFGRDKAIQARGYGPGERIFYSLDMLLPVIELRYDHYAFDLASRAKYYLYVHKLMGYVVATFLIAALTGARL